jgi:23S rRNA (uracil1939-C5)-methyltransferase
MEQSVQVRIHEAAYRGKGVGKLPDGRVVFVPHTLPGELVAAEIVRRRKSFAEARLLAVLEPSPARIVPACPLSGVCPGCCYQHVAYDTEVKLKQMQLASLLQRMAGVDPSVCRPPVASPRELAYRNKIELHAAAAGEASALGYFAEDNRTILDVKACLLAAEPIQGMLAGLRSDGAFMRSLPPQARLVLRWTGRNGPLHWLGRAAPGEDGLTEHTALGDLSVPRGSFFQVNPWAAGLLLARVEEQVAAIRPPSVIDLYCGAGVFAIAAARAGCANVVGVDSDAAAISAARDSAGRLGVGKAARFLARPADAGLAAAQTPDGPATLLIVDPPRDGLLPGVLLEIGRRRFADVLYVSCAADTLARDVKRLAQHGYTVASSQLVDMFPRTAYFESVTRLRR